MAHISSVSSNPQSSLPVKTRANIMSPIDREIEQLMKQKGIINEKIASIRSDEKLDSKQKDERIKLLNMDLQLLESQIMQKRMEKAENNKNDKNASPQKENSSKKSEADISNQEISGPSMEKLLQASNLHDQLTKMASVRRSLKVEADDLRLEVKKNRTILEIDNDDPNDVGKTEMRKNLEITVNKSKNEQALDIDKKIYELDRKISEKIEDTIEGIQNDDKQVKVVTEEVSGQKDASVSAQPVNTAGTLRPNQDTGKNNIGIDIRV